MVLLTVGNKTYNIQVAYVITKLVTWYIVETGDTLALSIRMSHAYAYVFELSDKTSWQILFII